MPVLEVFRDGSFGFPQHVFCGDAYVIEEVRCRAAPVMVLRAADGEARGAFRR